MNLSEKKRYNLHVAKAYNKDEQFTPFSELCHYAEQYHLIVELEKPFTEFDQIFLRIIDSDGIEIKCVTLEDISEINEESASILNELSSTKH